MRFITFYLKGSISYHLCFSSRLARSGLIPVQGLVPVFTAPAVRNPAAAFTRAARPVSVLRAIVWPGLPATAPPGKRSREQAAGFVRPRVIRARPE